MEKKITVTISDKAIVKALRAAGKALTLAEMNAFLASDGIKLAPGHVVSAKGKGLIDTVGDTRIEREGHRLVEQYSFVTDAELTNADGKPFNYTEGEKEILAVAKTIDGNFTLKQLAVAMGKDKLSSGSISGLVNKKGNIVKTGEKVSEPCLVPATVKLFDLNENSPLLAEIGE